MNSSIKSTLRLAAWPDALEATYNCSGVAVYEKGAFKKLFEYNTVGK